MAIYNPKRARELEAAARLAESQRQRELAKGQREQRTTEQILGLVEGLIGAAPQAAQAFEQSQAERVLAGERPLEMEAAKDPFTGLGRLLFEPGIKAKAQKMAQERAPAELARLRPLATEAIKQTTPLDMPIERKEISKEEFEKRLEAASPAFGQKRAEAVLAESPIMQLLSEQQRKAMAAGETQRVQAEAEAAERQSKLDEAQITKLTAGAAKAAGGELPEIKQRRQAAGGDALAAAASLEDDINTVGSPELTGQTMTKVRQVAEQAYIARGGDPTSNQGAADVSGIVKDIYATYRKKDFGSKDYEFVENSVALDRELQELDALRKKVKFEPTEAQMVRERISGIQTVLKLDEINKAINDLSKLAEFTDDQIIYLRLALQTKNSLIKASNDGYNVTNADYPRLSEIVADPMTPDEVWEGVISGTRRQINQRAKDRFDIISAGRTAPQSVRRSIESLDVPEVALTGGEEKVLKDVPGDVGEVFSNLFTLLGQAGISATGVDDAIKMGEQSDKPEIKQAAEAARGMLDMFLGMGKQPTAAAPQTSQQQMRAIDETEESAFAKLKSQGKLKPGQAMFIITNSRGKVSYVTADDNQQGIDLLERAVRKKDPNASIQKYTGNLAGGQ